jgi:hypothetical protein
MTTTAIRELFFGQIDRKIEEVIKVDQDDAEIVEKEISEYILTESIERNMLRVLDPYRQSRNRASDACAVWVSGFFGAGKSSFAKYLGLALANRELGGKQASNLLASRARDKRIEALIKASNIEVPTDVILFDVSADRNVQSKEFLSAIIYKKLMWHLGYSVDMRVCELEIELEDSGRMDEFMIGFNQLYPGQQWSMVKTRRMQALSVASAVMHRIDPTTYPDAKTFSSIAIQSEPEISPSLLAERAIRLMEGKRDGRNLVFVIDEVSRFIIRDVQKILDLQSTVQQLGKHGRGRIWLIATAQESLDDVIGSIDDQRLDLAILQDRFPIKVVLETSDISEVTHRRVLSKSAGGEALLSGMYGIHQGRLATHTKLDTKIRLPELTSKAFADLYPLLPYQIELIIQVVSGLRLSGGASKQFGGANRAIIKLAQELLTNPQSGLADEALGALVTLDRVYDLQSNNIDSQYRGKISDIAIKASHPLAVPVAKAICLLQFVDQVPATERNIAVVLHPRVDCDSIQSQVQEACEHLYDRRLIRKAPDSTYKIPTPQEEDWEQTRTKQEPSAQDRHNLLQEALRQNWDPVPSAGLGNGVRTFKAALHFRGGEVVKGDVPVKVERVDGSENFEDRVEQLRQQSQQDTNTFFWAMRPSPELDRALREWFRSQKVIDLKGRDASSKGQVQLVSEERRKLEGFRQDACRLVDQALIHGQVLLNGGPCAIGANASRAVEAIREALSDGLAQIYDRFGDAAVSPSGDELSKLLSADNLKGLTGSIETLRLCKEEGGQWVIDTNRPALQAVLNRIKVRGGQSGKELVDFFGAPRYGWTLDAVKFLVAALQVGSHLKATHNAQSFVGVSKPELRPLFTNNSTFRATAFGLHEATLNPQAMIEASLLFRKFAGKTVQGIAAASLAKEIRASAKAVNADLNGASKAMVPLELPGREALDQACEQVSTWQDSDDEEVVKAFRASAEAVKEQWQRATAIKEVLDTRLEDLRQARHALGDRLWGQLQQESDLPLELIAAENQLRDLLQSLSFYERIPEIDQLTKKLEDAYTQRRSEAQQALAAQVQQRIAQLQQASGFAELDSERQEQLTEPLRQRAHASEGLDLVRLRDQPAMLEGVLRQQEQKAQKWAFPAQEVSTVNVRELCREPFDSAGLEEVLGRIRQRCEEELGNDRKVLLQ